jgi:hypothetical protein
METDAFTATPSEDHKTAILLIVIASLIFVILIVLILICLCRWKGGFSKTSDAGMSASDLSVRSNNPVENLIPPLFYTENLRDPLMQEDLSDRIATMRAPRIA